MNDHKFNACKLSTIICSTECKSKELAKVLCKFLKKKYQKQPFEGKTLQLLLKLLAQNSVRDCGHDLNVKALSFEFGVLVFDELRSVKVEGLCSSALQKYERFFTLMENVIKNSKELGGPLDSVPQPETIAAAFCILIPSMQRFFDIENLRRERSSVELEMQKEFIVEMKRVIREELGKGGDNIFEHIRELSLTSVTRNCHLREVFVAGGPPSNTSKNSTFISLNSSSTYF